MAWLIDIFKRLFGNIFSKPKDAIKDALARIQSEKERWQVLVSDYSHQADKLNESFKTIIARYDNSALERLKSDFKQLNHEALVSRNVMSKLVQELRDLELTSDQPAILENIEEFQEMLKSLNLILKHHKAIQHFDMPKPQLEEPESPEVKPPDKPPIRTALENVQNQHTVLIKLPDDFFKEPPEQGAGKED